MRAKLFTAQSYRIVVLLLLLVAALVVLVPSATAVHDEQFQLDGDISQATSTPCHAPSLSTCPAPAVTAPSGFDWSSFFQAGTTTDASGATGTPGGVPIPGSLTNGFDKSVFVKDFVSGASGPDISTFTNGTKDIQGISGGGLAQGGNWTCASSNNVGSKVDLINAYALLYHKPTGTNILYAGLERGAPEGTADAGFWLLKDNSVGCNPTVNSGNFSGQHRAGDVLVVVEYTGGGAVTNVSVFQWRALGAGPTFTPTQEAQGCLSSNPVVLTAADCNTTPVFSGLDCKSPVSGGDTACATVNGDPNACPGGGGCKPPDFPVTPPWPAEFPASGGITSTMDTPQFLEMGINLTAFKLDVGCFSKFLPDTRESASLTSTAPDYALGSFNTCTSTTVTTPSAATIDAGSSISDTAAVTGNSFFGSPPKPTGNVTFYVCGPGVTSCADNDSTKTLVGGVKTLSGTCNPDVTECATANSDSISPTVPGRYCFRAVYAGDSNYTGSADGGSNECFFVRANPTITTQVRTPSDTNVTSSAVAAGTVIHDHASFDTGSANSPIPAGSTATFHRYTTIDCTGPSTDQSGVAVSSGAQTGTADSSTFTPAAGQYGYLVDFVSGDTNAVLSKTGTVCEPFTVVDANIQISPLNANNAIGTNHTLTGHVNVNTGTGFVNAPAGTLITFSKVSGPGSFVGGTNTCLTILATGECTVQITSSTPGVTVVNAATDVTVSSISLHRATGDANAGDSANANKNWVDANIQISPLNANNAIGTNHTLTGHVNVNTGTGFVNAPAGTLITFSKVSGPGSFVGGTNTCLTILATGECTVQITSSTPGVTVVNAATDVTVSSISLHRATGDANAGDSANANKNWVDANIQISPLNANNAIGTNHTLTGHVNVNTGTGFVNAPAGTLITFSKVSGPGSFVGGTNTCLTILATGECTVQITSSTPGVTVVNAATDVTVSSISLHRATGDANAGDSANANKNWVDANIQISPLNANNAIGTNHTLTGHVNVNTGTGFVNAPAGTLITFSKVSGPGSFVGGTNTCLTILATGECTVQITSSTPGVTVVNAATDVTVSSISLHRATGDANAGDSANANKNWVDANIQISPLNANNAIGTNHTLTGHVNVNTGTGFVNAPAGTLITFSKVSGPGSFVGGTNTCLTILATGECTVQITSSTPGVTVVNAATDVTVSSISLHRATGDANAGDSANANKNWVDANIQISPLNANNAIGTNHTLTGHVNVNTGTGFVNAPAGTLITFSKVSGPGSFVGGTNTCLTILATGECTVQITSSTPGVTVVNAATDVTVSSISLHRATGDANAGDSANANKNWVDANIQISPLNANNAIGTNHTLTGHVNVNTGTGFVNAPAGTLITFSKVSGPGSFVGGTNTCLTILATGECTVQITSSTPGVTVVNAATDVTVSSISLHRATGDANAGDSANANKNWVDANIQISPATADNSIDTNHTLTGHVNVNDGTGFVNAPAGTLITFSIVSGPGSFVGGTNTCLTILATGECTVQITSSTPGVTVVNAATDVTVSSISLHRATGDANAGDSANAQKHWLVGTITIIKNTVGGNGTFDYTATGASEMPASFSLTTVGGTKQQAFGGLPAGSYTVTESGPSSAWDFVSLSCTTGGSNSGQVATITLPMGGSVTCTYTNGLKPTLKIVKNVTGGSGTFTFDTTGGASGMNGTSLTPPANGSASAGPTPIDVGASSVSEHTPLPAGWVLTDSACTGVTATGSNQVAGGSAFYTFGFTTNYGDAVVCTYTDSIQVLTTRTQGFWATHTALSDNVWNGTGPLPAGFPVGGSVINPLDPSPVGSPDAYLCGVLITAVPQTEENVLLGGFWSNIAKTSTGKKRSSIDQARMQMLQQYFAAVLNVHMFGSGSEALLSAARAAYCGTNEAAIGAQVGILGSFNTSGDNQSFDPGQSATAQLSKGYADLDAWDTPQYAGKADEDGAPKLALTKVVAGGIAAPADFKLQAACVAGGPCTTGSGVAGQGGVASSSVVEGTYTLTDVGTGVNSAGYSPGSWSCTGTGGFALGPTATGTATLALTQGAVVSCSITNTHP